MVEWPFCCPNGLNLIQVVKGPLKIFNTAEVASFGMLGQNYSWFCESTNGLSPKICWCKENTAFNKHSTGCSKPVFGVGLYSHPSSPLNNDLDNSQHDSVKIIRKVVVNVAALFVSTSSSPRSHDRCFFKFFLISCSCGIFDSKILYRLRKYFTF